MATILMSLPIQLLLLLPTKSISSTARVAATFYLRVGCVQCSCSGICFQVATTLAHFIWRPSVALYSSDVMPANCAVYSSPTALRPDCDASPLDRRSCACGTQSLLCCGCGAAVGYSIVHPCARCSASISSSSRSTNGHRFVFHSTEIVGTERHYIDQEPGVIAYRPTSNAVYYRRPPFSLDHSHALADASRPGYLVSPPLDSEVRLPSAMDPPSPSFASFPDQANSIYPHRRAASPALSDGSLTSLPPLIQASPPPFGLPAERVESPSIPPLAAGDVLYWHHLVKHGEIPSVVEDPRARSRSSAKRTANKIHFDR
ncbi:hypothetical protein HMN09_00770100 [Mycena chlorophos]|uniref:Uncharacterized protein n=1 Tax=Mycena chlorophos TaxID=658473 RepID=A0A8H6SUJ2_MYCCL|nr:hypothetical protein HMN09_00770100 [Mycena chlorophos]